MDPNRYTFTVDLGNSIKTFRLSGDRSAEIADAMISPGVIVRITLKENELKSSDPIILWLEQIKVLPGK